MIHYITAIKPEAEAVRTFCSMKKYKNTTAFPALSEGLTIYQNEADTVRLLVTGSGKYAAATAVTQYLALLSCEQGIKEHSSAPVPKTQSATAIPKAQLSNFQDKHVFCNLGICGSADANAIGNGYLCISIADTATGRRLYPEVYTHPFSEAYLISADQPITSDATQSAAFTSANCASYRLQKLPTLFDMEGFTVLYALNRSVQPADCFTYKIVSDACNGAPITPADVTALCKQQLPSLHAFLQSKSDHLESVDHAVFTNSSLANDLCEKYPFSETMVHTLSHLLAYADLSGLRLTDWFGAEHDKLWGLRNPSAKGFTKKEAGQLLLDLEQYVLHPSMEVSDDDSLILPAKLRLLRHLYVEEEVLNSPVTKRLIARFPQASVIPIKHYKDVFNRSRQDRHAQVTEPSFILAANHAAKLYPGAPVCQSFGEEHFYYTSCIMNCIYDCDYCYLQGMYPSGNIVVFVNTEDYFAELEALLRQHPVYLCCSYDSDLTALGGLFPHAKEFCEFAAAHSDLRLELRTKCAAPLFLEKLPAAKNIVMAYTVSPQPLIDRFEHYSSGLLARLKAAKKAAELGFSLRLCIDPVLDVPDAPTLYRNLVDAIFTILKPEDITDISLGVFRISKDYLKQLRSAKPNCVFSHYPYRLTDGVCHYEQGRAEELLGAVTEALISHGINEKQLFFWKPEDAGSASQLE